MAPSPPTEIHANAFLALHLRRLADRLSDGSEQVLEDRGIRLRSRTISIATLLSDNRGWSVADLAATLDCSHQLISQRVASLRESGFAEVRADPADARRQPLVLTESGRSEVDKLEDALADADRVFAELFDEIDGDLAALCSRALTALDERPLRPRFTALRKAGR